MPLTNYEKQVRHRAKVKAKIARYEWALYWILTESLSKEDRDIARNALNAEAEA